MLFLPKIALTRNRISCLGTYPSHLNGTLLVVFIDAAEYFAAEVTFLKQDNDGLVENTLHFEC